jgi:hypothetical protein
MTIDHLFHRAITDFFNSVSVPLTTVSCPNCGSAVEYRNFPFSYGGKTWEIPFPICPECNPIVHVPMYRA